MIRAEIIDKLEKCMESADIYHKISTDEDEEADFTIAEDKFCYCGNELPYKFDDFLKIRYYISPRSSEFCYENNYVRIDFKNGDSLKINWTDIYSAKINGKFYDCDAFWDYIKELNKKKKIKSYSEQEILEKLAVCFRKAGMYCCIDLESEEGRCPDQIADIGFLNKKLYVGGDVVTLYSAEEISSVKYFSDEYDRNSVTISFKNGEYISVDERGDYEAYIYDGKLGHRYYGLSDIRIRYDLERKAQEAGVANDEFVIVDNSLVKYNGQEKNITLPEGIICIENGIFEHSNIVSVILPRTLKYIGDYVFRNCKKLRSVQLNDGLEIIGNRAFCACGALDKINLPSSLKEIKECAFLHSKIKSFSYVPDGCIVAEDVFEITS